MILPESFEGKLGIDVIRQRLRANCLSAAGAARVDEMQFTTNGNLLRSLLKQTLELNLILERGEGFPSRYFFDGDEWLERIAVEGSYLDGEEFLKLAQAMQTAIACRKFIMGSKALYPELSRLAEAIDLDAKVPSAIMSRIDDNGVVRDNASPELSRIRKKLRDEQAQLRKLGDQLFRRAVEEKWVPEGALPTIREGRLVIPILAEHKRRMKGFILDESATGQTIFMEPAEMLEANNEIRDLEHAERREVLAILKALADELRKELPALRSAFKFLAVVDFVRAKAKFALEIGGELPTIVDEPELTWWQARHPLLQMSFARSSLKREVVPLDISLGPVDRMLLVSGPNAGGKSVCLKTVGLLQYMVQCGLLIPLSDRSRVGIFDDIFLDIGDQQSIENDLSTYSSHLRNMASFIAHADDRSLVLMDELGSGTDPNFGGAIAQAVLEELLSKNVWGVATTHYYNLKLFAGQRKGIVNGAMRFDEQNLVPLYILDIGKPGSSFALEIARQTGLPPETLREAESLVGKDLAGFEKLVRSLDRERQELSTKLTEIERREKELTEALTRYKHLSEDLEQRKKQIIGKAREEAAELLRNTNREIEKTIRHIRENRAERKETLRVRKGLEALTQRVVERGGEKKRRTDPIREGDRVRIEGQQGSGVVLSIKGNTASVQFGELKSLVKVSRLERVEGPHGEGTTQNKPRPSGIDLGEKRARFSSTLDVRGKRVEEVVPILESFVDTAILLGQAEVRILHGKGEGILRKVIREHLRRYQEVASVSDEHVERGGDGITIVVLK